MTNDTTLGGENINVSSSNIQFQRTLRVEKLDKLKSLGINSYPVESQRDYTLYEVSSLFDEIKKKQDLVSENEKLTFVTLAGRLKTKRVSGKISFGVLEDVSLPIGFQIVFKVDELPQGQNENNLEVSIDNQLTFHSFKNVIDEGDYLQVTGRLEKTIAGENSLFVSSFKILTKSLRPLPDKLDYENIEARYLDKVADFKMNTVDKNGLSVRDVVKLKSKYWSIWREEMLKEGFMEVINPTLELLPGGAECKPFVTYYNELEQEVYLRIALELPLKKLIAGGFERVFEIGRVFRNESSSPMHLQEFTFIEWYCAYTDYIWAAKFVKRVYQRIVKEVLGQYKQIDYFGNEINWDNWCSKQEAEKNGWELLEADENGMGWPKINYFDAVRFFSDGKIDTENKTDEELYQMCLKNGITDVEVNFGTATLLDKLWKKSRLNTANPFFLINPPVELEPLAKRDTKNPNLVQRWQVVAGRAEHGKAFSELNDPIDQFGRFEKQQEARDNGNEEAQFMDMNYVKAMEYGMPPMSGFGISDRFLSSLLGKNIRDIEAFPHVRSEKKDINEVTKVFHIVLNGDKTIEEWQRLNAVAHLTGSVIAHNLKKQDVIDIEKVVTKDGLEFPMDLRWGIHIKQTENNNEILELFKTVQHDKEVKTTLFGEDFYSAKNDEMAIETFRQKDSQDVKWVGVLLYGQQSKIEKLTKTFNKFGSNSSGVNDLVNSVNTSSIDNLHSIDPDEVVNHFGNNTVLEYWIDSYRYNSTSNILGFGEDEIGKYCTLDKTIFYPQGGGQPSDIGVIKLDENNYFNVTKCLKHDGIVRHYGELVGEIYENQTVNLVIDSEKRLENVNLHSAAHLIDYALDKLGVETSGGKGYSFPAGPYNEYILVNSDTTLDGDFATKLEDVTNNLRLQNIPFSAIYTKDVEGNIIRNVEIDGGKSSCPCAGTHVKNTSEFYGKIVIREAKIKKGVLKIKYQVER